MKHFQNQIEKASIRVGTRSYATHIIIYELDHIGKSNHKLNIDFSVHQSENSNNDVNFYIMNKIEYENWINTILPDEFAKSYSKIPKEARYVIERVKEHNLALDVHGDGIAFFIFDNRFSSLTGKDIEIQIFEEWDEEEQPPNKIVTTIPAINETLKEEAEMLIDDSNESLYIISPYFDLTVINRLIRARDRGVDIKIILRNDPELKGLAKEGQTQIIKQFPNNHKLLKSIHSRIIISDRKRTLISSADLDQKSLQALSNLGVTTQDTILIKKVISYFDYLWSHND